MIQRIRQAKRKGRASAFILLIPKWTKIKDPNEIEKSINNITSISANAQISDNNQPQTLLKTSSLSQIVNAKDKLSDLELVAKLGSDLELDEEANLFFRMLVSDADQN